MEDLENTLEDGIPIFHNSVNQDCKCEECVKAKNRYVRIIDMD